MGEWTDWDTEPIERQRWIADDGDPILLASGVLTVRSGLEHHHMNAMNGPSIL